MGHQVQADVAYLQSAASSFDSTTDQLTEGLGQLRQQLQALMATPYSGAALLALELAFQALEQRVVSSVAQGGDIASRLRAFAERLEAADMSYSGAGGGTPPWAIPPGGLPPGTMPPWAMPPWAIPPGGLPPGGLPPWMVPQLPFCPAVPPEAGNSFWDWLRENGSLGGDAGEHENGQYSNKPSGAYSVGDSVWETGEGPWSASALNGEFGIGIGQTEKHGPMGGIFLGGSVIEGGVNGTMLGDRNLGLTGGLNGTAVSGDAFLGYRDKTVGAEAGVNLASVQGELGANVAGVNVAATAEVGLKLEVGVAIGKRTEVKLGPISVGLNFGSAD